MRCLADSASICVPDPDLQTDAFLFTANRWLPDIGRRGLFLVFLGDFAFSLAKSHLKAKRKMRLPTVHNYAGLVWHSLY